MAPASGVSTPDTGGGGSITLAALSLTPNTAAVGSPYNGAIAGKMTGSTLSLTGAGSAGLSVIGSTVTGTPTTEGTVNVVETLAGATNSPNTSGSVLAVSAGGQSSVFANGVWDDSAVWDDAQIWKDAA